jgi:ribosomal protein S27AE
MMEDSPRRCVRCGGRQLLELGQADAPSGEHDHHMLLERDVCPRCGMTRPVSTRAFSGRELHHRVQTVLAHRWEVWDAQGRPDDPDHSACGENEPCHGSRLGVPVR